MAPANDPAAALAALHDIVVPAPVAWWPPAPGWYGVGALVLVLAGWRVWRIYRRWRGNAYRRDALREVVALRAALGQAETRAAALADLAALLRRVAMHATPRVQVATLSGDAWLSFLDAGLGGDAFRHGDGRLLVDGPYRTPSAIARMDAGELDALCALAARWLRARHPARGVGTLAR